MLLDKNWFKGRTPDAGGITKATENALPEAFRKKWLNGQMRGVTVDRAHRLMPSLFCDSCSGLRYADFGPGVGYTALAVQAAGHQVTVVDDTKSQYQSVLKGLGLSCLWCKFGIDQIPIEDNSLQAASCFRVVNLTDFTRCLKEDYDGKGTDLYENLLLDFHRVLMKDCWLAIGPLAPKQLPVAKKIFQVVEGSVPKHYILTKV